MKELNMKPEEIANLVALSREKHYAIIIPVDSMYILAKALLAAEAQMAELESIKAAAEKLVRCKGRYHAEQNYRALAALFGVTTPDIAPPVDSAAPPAPVKLPRGHILDCFGRLETDDDGVWLHKDAVIEALKDSGLEVADE